MASADGLARRTAARGHDPTDCTDWPRPDSVPALIERDVSRPATPDRGHAVDEKALRNAQADCEAIHDGTAIQGRAGGGRPQPDLGGALLWHARRHRQAMGGDRAAGSGGEVPA